MATRNPQWDYDQGWVFGFGTVGNPELFRININTQKNSISQETFAKLEGKLASLVPAINKVLKTICKLVITMRKPYDPDASVDDEDFV